MPFVAEVGDAAQTRGEVTIEWKIPDFLSLSDKVDDVYRSPVFTFAGTRWCLGLYPNGQTSHSSSGHVGLYLTKVDSTPPQTVYFTLGIKHSIGEKDKKEVKSELSKKDEGSGFCKFWSRSDLMKRKSFLLPDNALTVTCDLKSEAHAVKGENKLAKSLLSMLESGDDSDLIIKVQEKEFRAHRNILRVRSPVFWAMFAHDMAEKQSNVVNIEDVDPKTFRDFLNHVYSGSCDQVSAKNVYSLYAAADKYDVGELKEACREFLKRNVDIPSFCGVLTLAMKHADKELTEHVTEFFCYNIEVIPETVEWQYFLKKNLNVGDELITKAVSKLRKKLYSFNTI